MELETGHAAYFRDSGVGCTISRPKDFGSRALGLKLIWHGRAFCPRSEICEAANVDLCRKTQASKLREKPRLGKNPELRRPANYTDQPACAHPTAKRQAENPTPHTTPKPKPTKNPKHQPKKKPKQRKTKEDPARTPGREEGEQLEQLQAAGKVAALEGSATNAGRIPLHELLRRPSRRSESQRGRGGVGEVAFTQALQAQRKPTWTGGGGVGEVEGLSHAQHKYS